jgi:hypothetical protein
MGQAANRPEYEPITDMTMPRSFAAVSGDLSASRASALRVPMCLLRLQSMMFFVCPVQLLFCRPG